jgi:hypothetical protein
LVAKAASLAWVRRTCEIRAVPIGSSDGVWMRLPVDTCVCSRSISFWIADWRAISALSRLWVAAIMSEVPALE